MSETLETVTMASLLIGGASALIIALDVVAGHPQHMWIMNIVWPITGLYAGPLALWGYYTAGRLSTQAAVQEAKARNEDAITTFLIFGHEIEKTNPVFWLMMQIAMLIGFLTAYPVNWWLLRAGLKEKM